MLGMGLWIPMRDQSGGGPSFTPEAIALFAAMTTPPTGARKILINNLIVTLQAGGVWSLLDCLWVMAAADSQAARLNWVNPATFTLSPTNSPTFTVDRGYTGDGATSGLTGPNLATIGGNYTLNSASLSIWAGTDVTENTVDFGNSQANIRTRNSATTASTRLNDVSSTNSTLPVNTAIGHTCSSRAAAGSYVTYKNGASMATVSVASTSILSAAATVCFSGATFSTKREQAAHIGGALTSGQVTTLYNALATYMTAVGA